MYGSDAPWDKTQHLLASIVDVLNNANWQRAGNNNLPRPRPMERPDPNRKHQVPIGELIKARQRTHDARRRG